MLEIYHASKFIKLLEEGGHTKPWLIEIETEENKNQPVVLKLYTIEHITQNNAVTKEIVGNFLAQEFDFSVPKMCLVNTNSNIFLKTIQNENLENLLQKIDDDTEQKPKFASFYIEGTTKLEYGISLENLTEINLEKLYFFDNFIRNADRGNIKTNMILDIETKEIYLIDHEKALDNIHNFSQFFSDNHAWEERFTTYHFAYNYLKQKNNIDFEEFYEYAKSLNFNKLNPYFEQLENIGYETQKDEIIGYLKFLQNNILNFIKNLKKSLT